MREAAAARRDIIPSWSAFGVLVVPWYKWYFQYQVLFTNSTSTSTTISSLEDGKHVGQSPHLHSPTHHSGKTAPG